MEKSIVQLGFPGGSESKDSTCNAGDLGSTPGSGRSAGDGNSNPFQYSFLENSMDRGAWQATDHGVAESDMTERLTLHSSVNSNVPILISWFYFLYYRYVSC